LELFERNSIFVGFKLDSSMRRQLDSLEGADQRYVSRDDSTFLRLCTRGSDVYVGKVVEEKLSTDRVDDIRRNVLSILQRICPETRLPQHFDLLVCVPEAGGEI
jgi:hypothetical protein